MTPQSEYDYYKQTGRLRQPELVIDWLESRLHDSDTDLRTMERKYAETMSERDAATKAATVADDTVRQLNETLRRSSVQMAENESMRSVLKHSNNRLKTLRNLHAEARAEATALALEQARVHDILIRVEEVERFDDKGVRGIDEQVAQLAGLYRQLQKNCLQMYDLKVEAENELSAATEATLKREMDEHFDDPAKLELAKSAWSSAVDRANAANDRNAAKTNAPSDELRNL